MHLKYSNRTVAVLLFTIFFVIFVFTNDAHRATIDEDLAHIQSQRIVTFESHPRWEEGERPGFELGLTRYHQPQCRSEYLCSATYIGHALTQVPFIFLNHYLGIISQDTLVLTNSDFNDPHYVFWRNTQLADTTFLELFYGPFFSALSVATFFSIIRIFNSTVKNSMFVTLLFGLSTSLWAYSQTSYNLIPSSFFILFASYFFFKYLKQNNSFCLIFSGIALGAAFLTRQDAILVGVVMGIFLIISLFGRSSKIKIILNFFGTSFAMILLDRAIDFIRFIPEKLEGGSYIPSLKGSFFVGATGLLFSPGLGIFVYYPILLTCFFSFVDFYKKNKIETFFCISVIIAYVLFYGSSGHWHGMNAYAARYMLATLPFFLIPLASSLDLRNPKSLKIIILILAIFGFIANFVYIIQDENWFVWGIWGSQTGLTSLGSGLAIHPVTFWTFEYSQLTHSILSALTNLQVDIYLYLVLGSYLYFSLLLGLISIPIGILVVMLKRNSI